MPLLSRRLVTVTSVCIMPAARHNLIFAVFQSREVERISRLFQQARSISMSGRFPLSWKLLNKHLIFLNCFWMLRKSTTVPKNASGSKFYFLKKLKPLKMPGNFKRWIKVSKNVLHTFLDEFSTLLECLDFFTLFHISTFTEWAKLEITKWFHMPWHNAEKLRLQIALRTFRGVSFFNYWIFGSAKARKCEQKFWKREKVTRVWSTFCSYCFSFTLWCAHWNRNNVNSNRCELKLEQN